MPTPISPSPRHEEQLAGLRNAKQRLTLAPNLNRLRETRWWSTLMVSGLGALTAITAVALFIQLSKLLLELNWAPQWAYTLSTAVPLMFILLVLHVVADQKKGNELGEDLRIAREASDDVLAEQDELIDTIHEMVSASKEAADASLETRARVKEMESKGFEDYVTGVQAAARVLMVPTIEPPDPEFLMSRDDPLSARTANLLDDAATSRAATLGKLAKLEILAPKRPRNPHIDRNTSYLAEAPRIE